LIFLRTIGHSRLIPILIVEMDNKTIIIIIRKIEILLKLISGHIKDDEKILRLFCGLNKYYIN
jgi:hypothetical protein